MPSVQNVLLVLLVFVIPVFPIMPFQKQCSFPGHSQHGTNAILNRNYIPAAALKVAKSENGIREERR